METFSFVAKYNFSSTHCTVVQRTLLYNDIYNYTVTNKTGCDNILSLIDMVRLSPLIYNSIFDPNNTTNFDNIIEILSNYISVRHNLEVSKIEPELLDDQSWNFTPYITLTDGKDSEIFVDLNDPDYDIDIYPLQNFKYLSNSSLTPYVHKRSTEPASPLINLEGIYLIQSTYENVASEIQYMISMYENQGYIVFEESDELDTLAQLWNITKIDSGIYKTQEFDEQWINNTLLTIKSGELPQYLVTGIWMFNLEKNDQNRAFILYAFYVYYLKLVINNPSLLDYIEKIEVHKNLSISASFGTYAEATGFTNAQISDLRGLKFSSYDLAIKNKIRLNHKNDNKILIIPIDNDFWLVSDGGIDNLANDITDLLKKSEDRILYDILSGKDINYRGLYLNGILSTDISNGLLSFDQISDLSLSGNLHFDQHTTMLNIDGLSTLIDLFPIGHLNDKLVEKINSLWKSGYFLSNWGITVYIYLGIIDNMYLRISPQLLELEYNKSYEILSSLLP